MNRKAESLLSIQVQTELNTGSSEIIQSSKDKQLIVFHDDNSTDPTHSMLSKDHFSNILNEPAGKIASQVLKWVVPQLIACWDDERIDVNRTLTRIVDGVFHHPTLRDYGNDGAVDGRRLMFGVVAQWWGSKDEKERQIMRSQLSRDGVEQGRNHKPGVQDSGHGCCKPLGMPTVKTAQSSGASGGLGGLAGGLVGGLAGGAVLGEIGSALAGKSQFDAGVNSRGVGNSARGGVGGAVLGAVVGGVGGELLGSEFSGSDVRKQTYQNQQYEADGSYTQSFTETGYSQPQYGQQRYGQAQYSETSFVEGGQRQQYQRYEQDGEYGRVGYGEQVVRESYPTYGGGYEETTETRYERPGGEWESEVRVQGRETASGDFYGETKRFSGGGGYREETIVKEETDESFGYPQRDRLRQQTYEVEQSRPAYDGYGGSSEFVEEEQTYQSGGGYGESSEFVEEQQPYQSEDGYGGSSEIVEEQQTYQSGGGYGESSEYVEEEQTYQSGGGYGGESQEYVEEQQSYESYGGGGGEEVVEEEQVEEYSDGQGGGYEERTEIEEDTYEDDGGY